MRIRLFYFFILALGIAVFALSKSPVVAAQGMVGSREGGVKEDHKTLSQVVTELLEKYDKNTIYDLDCAQITESEFEELGDAVMSVMHPDEQVHERMDRMMGGEGSDSLKDAHIRMASNYLGCNSEAGWKSDNGYYGMGMMRGFRSNAYGQFDGLLTSIIKLMFIVLLVVSIRLIWKKGGKLK